MKLHLALILTLCSFINVKNELNEPLLITTQMVHEQVKGAALVTNENIVPLCPAEMPQDKKYVELLAKHKSYEYGYCLFQKSSLADQQTICTEEVKPVLKIWADEKHEQLIQCGPNSEHLYFRYGFQLCGTLENLREVEDKVSTRKVLHFSLDTHFASVYDLCINTKKGLARWTKHDITATQLFAKDNHEKEQDPVISIEAFAFKKKYYEQIQKTYAKQKNNKYKMNPNFMVPKDHVNSKHWEKATNHYIVVAPLWDRLQKLMTAINQSIKKLHFTLRLQSQAQFLIIYTRVVNLPRRTYPKAGSMAFNQNAWYKLLYEKKFQTAVLIVIQNTPERPPGTDTKLCEIQIHCSMRAWFDKLEKFGDGISNDDLQYAFCCQPTYAEVLKLFNINLNIVENMKIDELLTNDSLTENAQNQQSTFVLSVHKRKKKA